MAFETLAERTNVGGGRISRFKFFDEPFAIFLNTSVKASADDCGPFANRKFFFKVNFALVSGIFCATPLQNLGMKFGAESEAIPTFAALKSNAMDAVVFREFADGDSENFFRFVKPQRHGGSLAGGTVSANHANGRE
jgi:hypothetical protein